MVVTVEARIAFLVFFFGLWCFLGLFPWAVGAVLTRGRGALPALPLALAGAAAAGVLVPLAGMRDALGFFLSLPAALAGSGLATTAVIRAGRGREPGPARPGREHAPPPDQAR